MRTLFQAVVIRRMTTDDGSMRSFWRSQLPFVAVLLCLIAAALSITVISDFYRDSLESVFVCDDVGCRDDERSWAERNGTRLGFTALSLLAAAAAVAVSRRQAPGRQRRGAL